MPDITWMDLLTLIAVGFCLGFGWSVAHWLVSKMLR